MFGPEVTCPQCKKLFRQGKHNQRFCQPQCKDDFHNAEKMIGYRLRRAEEAEAELEEAEELRELRLANGNGAAQADPEPFSEMMNALKPAAEPEPSFKRAW